MGATAGTAGGADHGASIGLRQDPSFFLPGKTFYKGVHLRALGFRVDLMHLRIPDLADLMTFVH